MKNTIYNWTRLWAMTVKELMPIAVQVIKLKNKVLELEYENARLRLKIELGSLENVK